MVHRSHSIWLLHQHACRSPPWTERASTGLPAQEYRLGRNLPGLPVIERCSSRALRVAETGVRSAMPLTPANQAVDTQASADRLSDAEQMRRLGQGDLAALGQLV